MTIDETAEQMLQSIHERERLHLLEYPTIVPVRSANEYLDIPLWNPLRLWNGIYQADFADPLWSEMAPIQLYTDVQQGKLYVALSGRRHMVTRAQDTSERCFKETMKQSRKEKYVIRQETPQRIREQLSSLPKGTPLIKALNIFGITAKDIEQEDMREFLRDENAKAERHLKEMNQEE